MKHVMIWVWRVPGVTQQMLGEVISVELACSNPLGSGYLVYKQLEGGRKQLLSKTILKTLLIAAV